MSIKKVKSNHSCYKTMRYNIRLAQKEQRVKLVAPGFPSTSRQTSCKNRFGCLS
jgi:hypothetical protein